MAEVPEDDPRLVVEGRSILPRAWNGAWLKVSENMRPHVCSWFRINSPLAFVLPGQLVLTEEKEQGRKQKATEEKH